MLFLFYIEFHVLIETKYLALSILFWVLGHSKCSCSLSAWNWNVNTSWSIMSLHGGYLHRCQLQWQILNKNVVFV